MSIFKPEFLPFCIAGYFNICWVLKSTNKYEFWNQWKVSISPKIYNYIKADYEQLREKEECYLKIKQEKLSIWVQVYNPEICFPA